MYIYIYIYISISISISISVHVWCKSSRLFPHHHDTMAVSGQPHHTLCKESDQSCLSVCSVPPWMERAAKASAAPVQGENLASRIQSRLPQHYTWGPMGGWTKAKVHDGIFDMLNADCLETWQDLSPWPSASNTASKCPRSLGGSSEKSLCWSLTCPSPCWSKSNSS